jgi:hypothetical protein
MKHTSHNMFFPEPPLKQTLTPGVDFQVASMFPERIDKMILDGVQNPRQYYHSPA